MANFGTRGIILPVVVVICALSFSVPPARATLITIEITATVDSVEDNGNYLEGQINPGDIITGTYTYESSTPDSDSSATAGLYEHHNPPAGISLNVGDFNFRTNPDSVDFVFGILNDYPPSMKDQFWLTSYSNLPLSNGAIVDIISWQLDDPTGTTLSSTALLVGPPILDDWQSIFGLEIHIEKSFIRAHVTSAVPEPATIVLFAIGAMLLTKRY